MRKAFFGLLLVPLLLQTAPMVALEDATLPACRAIGAGTFGLCTIWTTSMDGLGADGPGQEAGWVVLADSSGKRVFAAGHTLPLAGGHVGTTAAYDARTGEVLWTHERATANNQGASERGLALSPDGSRLHAIGNGGSPQRTVLTTLAADDGADLWQVVLPFAGLAVDIAAGPDGTVYASSGPGASVAAVTRDGALAWTTTVSAGIGARTSEVLVPPTGDRVVAVGSSGSFIWVAALESATGALQWTTHLPFFPHSPHLQEAVLSTDGRRLFVVGYDHGLTGLDGWDYVIANLDVESGAVVWSVRYDEILDPKSFEAAWAVDAAPDGSAIYVTGLGTSLAGDDDYLTLALHPDDGSLLWTARFNAGAFTFDDVYAGLVVSPDGDRVYIGGTSSLHPAQLTVVAYDAATGHEAWRFAYLAEKEPSFGYSAMGLAVSPDSRTLFVTGDANADFFTMALDRHLGLALPGE